MVSRRGRWFETQSRIAGTTLAIMAEQAPLLPLPVAFLDRIPLVVRLLAAGERDLDLRLSLRVEIDGQRDDGQALPVDRAMQFVDLALLQEQLSPAARFVVHPATR